MSCCPAQPGWLHSLRAAALQQDTDAIQMLVLLPLHPASEKVIRCRPLWQAAELHSRDPPGVESRSLQLVWEPPSADNGAFVMGYSAESRQGQGKSWQLLYSGRDTCCQVGHTIPYHNVFAALALDAELDSQQAVAYKQGKFEEMLPSASLGNK